MKNIWRGQKRIVFQWLLQCEGRLSCSFSIILRKSHSPHMGLAQNYGTNDPRKWSCLVGKPSSYWGLIILSHGHIEHTQFMVISCVVSSPTAWFLGLLNVWMGIHSLSEAVACWVLVGSLQEQIVKCEVKCSIALVWWCSSWTTPPIPNKSHSEQLVYKPYWV